jgi:hypothetical protein
VSIEFPCGLWGEIPSTGSTPKCGLLARRPNRTFSRHAGRQDRDRTYSLGIPGLRFTFVRHSSGCTGCWTRRTPVVVVFVDLYCTLTVTLACCSNNFMEDHCNHRRQNVYESKRHQNQMTSKSSQIPLFTFLPFFLLFLFDPKYGSRAGVEGWSVTRIRSMRSLRRSRDHIAQSLCMAPRKKIENVSGKSTPQISPDLLDFFSKKESSTESEQTIQVIPAAFDTSDSAAPSFVPFADSEVESTTDALDSARLSSGDNVATLMQQLEAIVSAAGPSLMQDIVPCIQQFSSLQQQLALRSANARGRGAKSGLGKTVGLNRAATDSNILTYQRMQEEQVSRGDDFHYRLFWVGSDAAMSTLGTGLHKVPLARLQEVFLSLSVVPSKKSQPLSKFRITGTEVIRILGPFPNVKNTLQGTCTMTATFTGSQYQEQWNIVWESMIDGTGKELINTTSNQRIVSLSIIYGDAKVLIASTDSEMGAESIFVFLRDAEMEEKLAALRVL